MFRIETLNPEIEAKTLILNDQLFHEALRQEPESKACFHVQNDRGDDFDIVYWDNENDIEPLDAYPKYVKGPFIAKYPFYDETDTPTLYLEFLQQFDRMMFEELNEYVTIHLRNIVQTEIGATTYCDWQKARCNYTAI